MHGRNTHTREKQPGVAPGGGTAVSDGSGFRSSSHPV